MLSARVGRDRVGGRARVDPASRGDAPLHALDRVGLEACNHRRAVSEACNHVVEHLACSVAALYTPSLLGYYAPLRPSWSNILVSSSNSGLAVVSSLSPVKMLKVASSQQSVVSSECISKWH